MLTGADDIFRYDSLPFHDSVRLLFIDYAPPDENVLLQCDLITVRLSEILESVYDGLQFTAVSYVWGQVVDRNTISIGSKLMSIGYNLHDALCHIRRPERPVIVWADGVCINQEDVCFCLVPLIDIPRIA